MLLEEYFTELMQDIFARSGAEKDFTETVFTERMCEFLAEQAVIENYSAIGYRKSELGIRADAANFNSETETLDLFVTDFRLGESVESLTQSEVTRQFRRLEKFFTESLHSEFYHSLDESIAAFELAHEIYENSRSISRVNFYLLSNAELSRRVGSLKDNNLQGYQCTYDIWDLSRLYRIESSGKEREEIEIDFTDSNKALGIPCLAAYTGDNASESYLLVMPGRLIADLYDRFGERLLEQNVRTFLQFRGNVNKGIRNTIQNEPAMFFAYNNGITATAERIETDENHTRIRTVTNFQIVNGGQTSTSLFMVMKKNKADLADIYVQVKLTVVPHDKVDAIVPRISEYANTQNKVNAADFFSNHPFHLRIEEFSRRLWAPSPEGGLRETHWFYERTRGQYANAQATLTPARLKEFQALNPKHQMFTKTDLAKFENSMGMLPHIVSLGAQKNFARFANEVGQNWEKNETQFNELYFKRIIAKAMMFTFLDRNIMKQDWYGGGYKANIVTYSLAKLAHMILVSGKFLDLDGIWKTQKLSEALESQLMTIAKEVKKQIQTTPNEITNVTEWCKREQCWSNVREMLIPLHRELDAELVQVENIRDKEKGAEKNQKLLNLINS